MENDGGRHDVSWWTASGVAVLCLIHIATVPFFERQFLVEGALWALISLLTVLGALVAKGKVSLRPKELALLLTGFICCWLVISPSFFYRATGEHWTPRPHAEEIAAVAENCVLLVPVTTLAAIVALRRKWWVALLFGAVQGWMAIVCALMTAGCVTGLWL